MELCGLNISIVWHLLGDKQTSESHRALGSLFFGYYQESILDNELADSISQLSSIRKGYLPFKPWDCNALHGLIKRAMPIADKSKFLG